MRREMQLAARAKAHCRAGGIQEHHKRFVDVLQQQRYGRAGAARAVRHLCRGSPRSLLPAPWARPWQPSWGPRHRP